MNNIRFFSLKIFFFFFFFFVVKFSEYFNRLVFAMHSEDFKKLQAT